MHQNTINMGQKLLKEKKFTRVRVPTSLSRTRKAKSHTCANAFFASVNASGIPNEIQDQYFDLKNDSPIRILYHEESLSQFRCEIYDSYPYISKHT